MKRIAVLPVLALAFALAGFAQDIDSTVHVKSFPGSDVGTKVANAALTCPASPLVCVLVIDPSLAAFANGTIPTLPANAVLRDYRTGIPSASTFGTVHVSSYAGADCSAKIATAQSQWGSGPGTFSLDQGCNAFNSSPTLNVNQGIEVDEAGTYTLGNAELNVPVSSTLGVAQTWVFKGRPDAQFVRTTSNPIINAAASISTCTAAISTFSDKNQLAISLASAPACMPTTYAFWFVASDNSDSSGQCAWYQQSNNSCNGGMFEGTLSGTTITLKSALDIELTPANNAKITVITPASIDLSDLTIVSTGEEGSGVWCYLCLIRERNVTVVGGAGPYAESILVQGNYGGDFSGNASLDMEGTMGSGSSQMPLNISSAQHFRVHDYYMHHVGEGMILSNWDRHGLISNVGCDAVGDDCGNTHGNNVWDISFVNVLSTGCTNANANCVGFIVNNGASTLAPDHDINFTNVQVSGDTAYAVLVDGYPTAEPYNIMFENVNLWYPPTAAPSGQSGNSIARLGLFYVNHLTVGNLRISGVQCGQNGVEILGVSYFDFHNWDIAQVGHCGSGTDFGVYVDAASGAAEVTNGFFSKIHSNGTGSYPYYVSSSCAGCINNVVFDTLDGLNYSGVASYIWPSAANMTNSPRVRIADGSGVPFYTWNTYVPTVTTASNYGYFTAPAAGTVTAISIYLGTVFSSCTTFPVIEVLDNTSSTVLGSITLSTASSYNVTTFTGSFAAGDVLYLKNATSSSGCSGTAGQANIAVLYHLS